MSRSYLLNTLSEYFSEIIDNVVNTERKAFSMQDNLAKAKEKNQNILVSIESLAGIAAESGASSQEVSASTSEQTNIIREIFNCAEDLNSLSKELKVEVDRFNLE